MLNLSTVEVLDRQEPPNSLIQPHRNQARDRRKIRKPNSGRMTVRGNPLQAHGMVTAVRSDNNRLDGYTGPANAGWTQQYVKSKYQDLNPYKGQENKLDLQLAKRQLKNNPLAQTLSN